MPRKKPKLRKLIKPAKPRQGPYFIVPRQDAPGCPIERFGVIHALESAAASQLPKLYHRTNRVAARRIMRHGFKDSTNYYMTRRMDTGVWLSNVPLDFNKGASGHVLLQVDTNLEDGELAQYEWIEKGKAYREWLVPAAIVNPRMTVTVVRHP